jgi:hypothetical protein
MPAHWENTVPVVFSQIGDEESPVCLYLNYYAKSEAEASGMIRDMLFDVNSKEAKMAQEIGGALARLKKTEGWFVPETQEEEV